VEQAIRGTREAEWLSCLLEDMIRLIAKTPYGEGQLDSSQHHIYLAVLSRVERRIFRT
jgi:hypothetical protein